MLSKPASGADGDARGEVALRGRLGDTGDEGNVGEGGASIADWFVMPFQTVFANRLEIDGRFGASLPFVSGFATAAFCNGSSSSEDSSSVSV